MKREKSSNEDDPYLSGAYIRSFVKQLSSSSTPTMREKAAGSLERETAVAVAEANNVPQQKKQVRRRLQTRKPYQEKLLNMAEARREIVTALKLHRAAMKQQQITDQPAPDFQKSRRNPRIYASNDVLLPYWPAPPPPPPPPPPVFVDFALPSQALGLNLNLHDFAAVHSSSIYSSSSPSTSSSPPPPPPPPDGVLGGGDAGRFEFLNSGEVGVGGEEEREEELVRSPFDEVMEFPPWLNADESCLHHVDSPHFFPASVLPCMEIEEIEGMDGDWLA